MNLIKIIFTSSLGKKYIMAITGMGLFVFIVLHLIGNLQIFLGAEAINRYGHFLQSNLELIWPARIGLLALVVLHVWSAINVSAENKRARPVAYEQNKNTGSSYASRTMMMSGLIIATFVTYHILHFTVQVPAVNFIEDPFLRDFKTFHVYRPDFVPVEQGHDVFKMMVVGFSHPLVCIFYIIGMALLCLHLSHGVSAMFSSLGLKNGAYAKPLDCFAKASSLLIFIGYVSIPIAIYFFHYGAGGCCK